MERALELLYSEFACLAKCAIQMIISKSLTGGVSLSFDRIYMSAGDNDFFPTLFLNTTNTALQTFANIQSAVGKLYDHGARK